MRRREPKKGAKLIQEKTEWRRKGPKEKVEKSIHDDVESSVEAIGQPEGKEQRSIKIRVYLTR